MSMLNNRLYLSKLPDVLRDNEDFQVFIQLAIKSFNIDLANIESFNDLVDPDKVPIRFLEYLGGLVGYKYIPNASDDFNRELITRMQHIYEQRGTAADIIMSATHGSNEGWVGADIFVPNYPIDRDVAKVVFTADEIFTHSRSTHSGGHVFSDSNIYRPGVILLTVPHIDSKIRDAINRTMPAGVKYYFIVEIKLEPSGDGDDVGEFGELSNFRSFKVVAITDAEKLKEVQEKSGGCLTFYMQTVYDGFETLIHSVRTPGIRRRSGRFIVGIENVIESNMAVSALSINTLKKPFLKHSTGSIYDDYIVSDTGELLDVKSKLGISAITRDIEDVEPFEIIEDMLIKYIPKRSMFSSARSGRSILELRESNVRVLPKGSPVSGTLTGSIDNYVGIYEITPSQCLYTVSMVENLKVSDLSSWDYVSSIEVNMV